MKKDIEFIFVKKEKFKAKKIDKIRIILILNYI